MKTKIRIAFLFAFLLVIVSGCVTPETTSKTTPIQTETPTSTELNLKIGETAKLPGIEVTVISINKPVFRHF